MAEAEQRPGSKMYGGNIDLVSRRENVQVMPATFVEACFLLKPTFFVSHWDTIGQGQYKNC